MSDSILTTIDHSWYGLIVHTLRTDGTISRASIQELIMFPYHMMLRCKIEGQDKIKDEHPITIAFIHNLWTNVDIVSEDDIPDEMDIISYIPKECSTLPSLVLSSSVENTLTSSHKAAFQYISKKLDVILSLRSVDN